MMRLEIRTRIRVFSVALFLFIVPITFAQTWAYTGRLQHDRQFHSATLLQNGQVLIAGGVNNDLQTMNRAELYTPSTGTFAYTSNLQHDRKFHTATLLQNGKVLIAAGENNDSQTINAAELYTPATGTFSYTGNLQHDRVSHSATLLPNGKVLIAGGFNNSAQAMNTAELYDPATGTFSYTGNLQHARAGHGAVLLTNGLVLIAGGQDTGGSFQTTAELYNPTTGQFSYTGSLVEPLTGFKLYLLPSAKALTIGGGNFEVYDPSANGFTRTASSVPVFNFCASLLQNGKVVTAGGRSLLGYNYGHTLNSSWLYTPTTDTLASTGTLPHDLANATCTLLQSGKVLAAGGVNNDGQTMSISELYTPGP